MSLPCLWPVPRWLHYLIVSAGLWLAAGLVMELAMYADALRRGSHPPLVRALTTQLPYFVPLALFTWGVALAFARAGSRGRAQVWHIGLPALALFVPVNAGWSTLVTLALRERPLAEWWQLAFAQELYATWTDTMIAVGSLAAIAAWNHWRQERELEGRWQAARADNYRLRLQLLQGQLEPHFLFNALNGVSALVRTGDRAVALTALAEISDLLRYALRASQRSWLSLHDEMTFVRGYMRVQTLRFGPGLVFESPRDSGGWTGIACPPMLLQPLVENAVHHGVEACDGIGTVALQVRDEPSGCITVSLSSPLCPQGADPVPGHGVGLKATRERLTLLYGTRARLQAGPQGERFEVSLVIPKEELPDGVDSPDR